MSGEGAGEPAPSPDIVLPDDASVSRLQLTASED